MKHLSKPKVCIIHNIISPYRLSLFEELNKNVDLTIIFCKDITKDRVWNFNLRQYTFKYKILKGFSIGPIIINFNIFLELIKTKFDIVIINSDPDVAFSNLIILIFAKVYRKKIILWSETINNEVYFFPKLIIYNNLFTKLILQFLKFTINKYRLIYFKQSDHFLAFSDKAKDFLISNNINAKNITRTYEIMPLDQLVKTKKIHIRNGKTFLYVGYLIYRKNIDLLINSFKKIKDDDARLFIVGTGPLENKLKILSKDDKRIIFFGNKEGIEKANLYMSADILVLPSIDDSWGLVVNEAIHYGLAVIVSDIIGATELINKNVGRIFQSNNLDQLYSHMSYLINHQDKLQYIQKNNLNNNLVSDVKKASDGFLAAIYKVL